MIPHIFSPSNGSFGSFSLSGLFGSQLVLSSRRFADKSTMCIRHHLRAFVSWWLPLFFTSKLDIGHFKLDIL